MRSGGSSGKGCWEGGGERQRGRREVRLARWRWGLWGEAGRRAPHAERAVMLTAVQSLRLACTERGALGERAGVLRAPQREL